MSVCALSEAASSFHRVKKSPSPFPRMSRHQFAVHARPLSRKLGPEIPAVAAPLPFPAAPAGQSSARTRPDSCRARNRHAGGLVSHRSPDGRESSVGEAVLRPAYRICLPACPVAAAGRRRVTTAVVGSEGKGRSPSILRAGCSAILDPRDKKIHAVSSALLFFPRYHLLCCGPTTNLPGNPRSVGEGLRLGPVRFGLLAVCLIPSVSVCFCLCEGARGGGDV